MVSPINMDKGDRLPSNGSILGLIDSVSKELCGLRRLGLKYVPEMLINQTITHCLSIEHIIIGTIIEPMKDDAGWHRDRTIYDPLLTAMRSADQLRAVSIFARFTANLIKQRTVSRYVAVPCTEIGIYFTPLLLSPGCGM